MTDKRSILDVHGMDLNELHHMLHKGQHKEASNISVFKQFYTLAA